MITADPGRRAARLEELKEVLARRAAPEDRDLLLSFAPVVMGGLPDRIALDLTVDALATRLLEAFRFVARQIPPAIQLYKGLPGIHVVARNPSEAEAAESGPGEGIPLETTVVETHTLDAPFIFESLKNYFRKAGLRVFSAIHQIFTVRRQWERPVWMGGPQEDGAKELYCHFQVERVESKERLRRIEHEVFSVLKSVFTAVEDYEDMKRSARDLAKRLRDRSDGASRVDAARAFLAWMLDDNYIFLASVRYRFGPDGEPHRVAESALGAFTDETLLPVVFPNLVEEVEARLKPSPDDLRVVDIDFANNASAIHHVDPLDNVIVREWGPGGQLTEATVFVGRLAKVAFTQKAADIPLLKQKHDWLLAHSGDLPNSHVFREIRALFNRFPKRELFYASAPGLKDIIDRIVYMSGDDEIAVHARRGQGYMALSIGFSRVRYSYEVERELGETLAGEFGPINFATSADLGAVSLLVFYFDAARLEQPVEIDAVRRIVLGRLTTWEDRVIAALVEAAGERAGRQLFRRYEESFSGLYREATQPAEVVEDVQRFERLEGRLEVRVIPRAAETATLKLYAVRPLGLTETLRTLQHLGLTVNEELRVPLALPEGRRGFLYRFDLEAATEIIASLVTNEERFAKALRALDEERATDDPLNELILLGGMAWQQVEVLRTVRNHILQIRPHYNVETVNGVLLRNRRVAVALHRSFDARFDPRLEGDRAEAMAAAQAGVKKAMESVTSLVDDEVLRAFDNLVRCALRTNYYQRPARPVLSIKVDSRRVEGMPSPRPMVEIYVHSRKLEGIHLRGGKVARGGIRWSDRHDDFRTEVLGLMKTQMVKNSIIVPVGSKGGFVLKGQVPARPALDAYLVDRYREFVSGLLDVTDNIVDGKVLHPPEVVRHDDDDPYLVVAADKGTAHLSDTANSVSTQYGFWLGDAFASGGSVGYDHKKVGITARGVWECVREHFRNLGLDVQADPFTVAGIGDMAGDVFGNGMLRSETMRLLAAFNHAHIFIDPDPDPVRSFAERERLFHLPRSTWRDYDPGLISAGGGVFDRSAKSIPLSPEVRRVLDIEGEAASGEEVVRRILAARVDLLYNGGIGTYVKASSEDDADVGDRTNDRVRVDAGEVRARVVAEGGNLGLTQRGRLEYWATRGGRINTDAVDNSGGVDMSDHEVNLKLLMDLLVKRGVVAGRGERNSILMEMTEEVAALVLADNRSQARALTLDGLRSAARYEEFLSFIEDMVGAGVLNRADDAVPTREDLVSSPHRERGLPRPLLAVLLGHTKMYAFDMVLQTTFPASEAGRPYLVGYFPERIRRDFAAHLDAHPLRREIVATAAVNHVINSAGITFLWRMMTAGKTGIGEVVAACSEVDRASGAGDLRERLQGMAPEAEYQGLIELEEALEAATRDALDGKARDAETTLRPVRSRLNLA
ncbi:MAG TPA: NAD-glutamate dehydrogenase domain-containing protein [Vicinamibacteria bacterium]|nr:NAD-glutamate dehydrogenase domain-containing protein [Vicinamibacteria bacterium]